MNGLDDPVDRIRSLAPVPPDPDDYDAVLKRVLRERTPRQTKRQHGRLRLAAAATAVAVLGASTAGAATGVTPSDAWRIVTGSPEDLVPNLATHGKSAPHGKDLLPDPSTARKVFTVPGPDGNEFAGWTIENYIGWQCVSAFFEPTGTTKLSLSQLRSSGVSCTESREHDEGKLFGDGTSGYSEEGYNSHVTLVYTAGNAVRVELVVSNGRRYPLPIQHGWFGGWFSQAQVPLGVSADIVAYDANGRTLRTFNVLNQVGCPKHQLC